MKETIVPPYYRITRNNKSIYVLSVRQFKEAFPIAGHNMQSRRNQLRYFVPDAIDWEMVAE
jgi:hypothetical protein